MVLSVILMCSTFNGHTYNTYINKIILIQTIGEENIDDSLYKLCIDNYYLPKESLLSKIGIKGSIVKAFSVTSAIICSIVATKIADTYINLSYNELIGALKSDTTYRYIATSFLILMIFFFGCLLFNYIKDINRYYCLTVNSKMEFIRNNIIDIYTNYLLHDHFKNRILEIAK